MQEDRKELFKSITKQFVKEATPFVIINEIYRNLFKRKTRNPLLSFNIDDFQELERYPYYFYSNNRQRLKGYMYNKKGIHPNKIIIFAHGFGDGGHHNYLDVINYLCINGFYVFGYDATGNDESQGDSINGFPQGVIDLDAAINFVEREYPKYPISLVGHSWGAYSVASVIGLHDEIVSAVSLSGFNKPADIIKEHSKNYAGEESESVLPYIQEYEEMKFGMWGKQSALDSLRQTKAKVMIIHSEDDRTVPITSGYDIYYSELANKPNIIFKRYKDKGHGTIYNSKEAKLYLDNFHREYKNFSKKKDVSKEELNKYIIEHLNRKIWLNALDKEMMNEIVTFLK